MYFIMKWKNKGKEFDRFIADYSNKNKGNVQFFVWGTGKIAHQISKTMQHYNCIKGFIDNDEKKQQSHFCGEEVISFDTYIDRYKVYGIILALNQSNCEQVVKQIEDYGLIDKKNIYYYSDFIDRYLPIIAYAKQQEVYISLCQISLTERCSLKCKKCAHGCFNVPNTKEDLSMEMVKKSADSFFKKVDYINEFVLIGGEPLLYKNLPLVIDYIGQKYRDKMNIFSITSNGTIMPSNELLKTMKKHNVLYRISNYSASLPQLKDKYQMLTNKLEENMIQCSIQSEDSEWMDYGFGDVNRNATPNELIDVFDKCGIPCKEIRGSKLYYCVMARSVSENLHMNVGEEDFLDLEKLKGEEGRKELLEFSLGYSDKGYLDMCNYCNGADAKNHPIPAAEQVK